MKNGYTGLSFPFRINKQGGITLSSVTSQSADHIDESITQILRTRLNERVMETHIGSRCEKALFTLTDDPNTTALVKFYIVDALLMFESRIKLYEERITVNYEDGKIITYIPYSLKSDLESTYTNTFEMEW